MSCSRVCTFVLRFHVFAFVAVVVGQFLGGLYTEDLLDRVNALVGGGWVLRDLINIHKLIGNGLAIASTAMLLVKLYLVVAKVRHCAVRSVHSNELGATALGHPSHCARVCPCRPCLPQPPRPVLKGGFTAFLVESHWWLLALLFPLQYATTVLAGDVAALLGVDFMTVFSAHYYIAIAILVVSVILLVQKLFLLPSSRAHKKKA